IALNPDDDFVSLRSIARKQNVSLKYLEHVMSFLVKNDLLDSRRGATGGYKLKYPASEYTISAIFKITESDFSDVLSDQYLTANETAKEKWLGLQSSISQQLNNFTLADLIERDN
ncbi:MAG: Rrf2 family transcriptional regulator, partial [Christensenellaceae bacterium]|nr:Rrf2 family transcriptional regulator [Christensenellaceae bacterium]